MSDALRPTTRYLNVDGLRLVCALVVLLFHYLYRGSLEGLYQPLLAWDWFSGLFKYGHIGVHIFFCISGFVIAFSAEGRNAFGFAVARFSRIYPTFIVCLVLLFVARWQWGGAIFPADLKQLLANSVLVPQVLGQDFMSGVYWSIVTEVLFYGWVFVLLWLGVFDRFRGTIMAAWLLVAAINELVFGQGALRMLLITEFAPFFIFGMVLQRVQVEHRVSLFSGAILATAVALAMAVLLRETADIRATYGIAISDFVSMMVLLTGMGLLVLALECTHPVLPARLLLWAGGTSYPLYLLHEGLGQIAFVGWRSAMAGPLLFLAVTAVVLTTASLVWWGFDRWAVPWTRRGLERGLLWLPPRLVQN